MINESDLELRLEELKDAYRYARNNGLSEETMIIAKHKIRQLEWILEK